MAMSLRDSPSPGRAQPKRLRFDSYILDLDRGCVLLDGHELTLRPKTFAVLAHFVENPGRLVSKDELFAAVWPNLALTDDVLVQSIGELRRALGDGGARLITTIPRRGYRFEASVSAASDGESEQSVSLAGHPSTLPSATHGTARAGLFARAPVRASLGLIAIAVFSLLVVGLVARSGIGTGSAPSSPPQALDRAPAGAFGRQPAIAVFPLVDQGNDPSRSYFADGLTQDIINALGRFSSLTVMSWNAVFPYKGRPASPQEVRDKLGVSYLVEGTVRRSGDRVRVAAQLVDTGRGRVLWSARFDEALADVFALQDKITTQIAGALAIRVEQSELRRASARPTDSLDAYDDVLHARPALDRPTRANIAEARRLLRRAVELDPNYAAAYAALAETYYIAVSMGWAESPKSFLNRAEDMANKALSLNDAEVRARIVLGRIDIFYHRFEQAKTEMDRAIAINPNDARGLAGRGNILMWLGQTDAAIEALEQALRIDPDLNAIDRFALSLAYYSKGRYDAAIEQAQINIRETTGANFNRIVLAAAYAQQKRVGDAARAVADIRRVDPTFDPQEFGSKFLNAADLEHLRDGLRKAGLYTADAGLSRGGN
ncbi:MAG TPA: tetratricopeptide repeat protein [Xanthobacteraceae bacterium]|nr:tetratricopeptide repeat protein [Xanthobacteraceae bacterium]